MFSYDATSDGNVVDQVVNAYDAHGDLVAEYQAHDGPVDTATTRATRYTYTETADANGLVTHLRRTGVTYPNGRQFAYGYGTSGGMNDTLSRLATITDSTGISVAFQYLGLNTIVVEDNVEASTRLSYLDASGDLTRLDRFGRVADQVWEQYDASGAATDAIDHYQYAYNRVGSRTSTWNALKEDLSATYQYDGLNRLTEWRVDSVLNKTWTLDPLGNSMRVRQYPRNDGDDGLDQFRTHTASNEIQHLVSFVGDAWPQPVYDRAGNMTTLVSGRTATYDAWNRLVAVNDAEATEDRYDMTYRYDAMNRRIRRTTTHTLNSPPYPSSESFYYDDYYSGQQVIETRTDVAADRQYVWSPRYIDAPILRDQYVSSSSGDEMLLPSDRLYYLGDANYNVTGLLYYNPNAAVWNVVERYAYTPYGQVQYRDSDWIEYEVQDSAYSNTTLYTGRTLDTATSLYYYRARYYDAALERFVSRDPIGYKGGMNLYEYVGDSPLTRIDPSGNVDAPTFDPNDPFGTNPSDDPQPLVPGGHGILGPDGSVRPNGPVSPGVQVPPYYTPRQIEGVRPAIEPFLPEVPKDPRHTPGFKLCQRDVQSDGTLFGEACASIINSAGGAHTYIQYGPVDNDGCPQPGTTGWGNGPFKKGKLPREEGKYHPDKCHDYAKCDGVLKYGAGAKQTGRQATDADILDCISKVPASKDYVWHGYNCRAWAKQALAQCGLCAK